MIHRVDISEEILELELIPSKRKTIGISISPKEEIKIRYPNWMEEETIKQFCEQKIFVILKCRDRARKKRTQLVGEKLPLEELYSPGQLIPVGNTTLTIMLIETKNTKTVKVYKKKDKEGRQYLCLATGISHQPQIYREAVVNYLREYAREALTQKVNYYSTIMGVQINGIRIKEQKTRWGSCSNKGNLNFNWKLILMPEQIWDYVVVHELAHRKQMNHSPQFWREVEKIIPDYQQKRSLLGQLEQGCQAY